VDVTNLTPHHHLATSDRLQSLGDQRDRHGWDTIAGSLKTPGFENSGELGLPFGIFAGMRS